MPYSHVGLNDPHGRTSYLAARCETAPTETSSRMPVLLSDSSSELGILGATGASHHQIDLEVGVLSALAAKAQ
jgi:hypothetical protein